MATITPNKTVNSVLLLAWQDIANTNVVVGSAVDVSTKYAASFGIRIARATATAFTAGWPNIRIEASEKDSGNDGWIPLMQFQPTPGTSLASTTFNDAAVNAGDTSFTLTSVTNISIGDVLFLGHSSAANYELVRVKSISGSVVTVEEPITYAHANGSLVTDQAEMYFPVCDLNAYKRVRAVADNSNSGQGIKVQVTMITHDSHTVV